MFRHTHRLPTLFAGLLALLLIACKPAAMQPPDLGRKTVEALKSGNEKAFAALLVTKPEYRFLINRMKRSEDFQALDAGKKRDFLTQSLDIARRYPQTTAATLKRFREIRDQDGQGYGIDWSKITFEDVRLYETSVFLNQMRYDEMQVIFKSDTTSYALRVEGLIKVRDGWKMVANALELTPAR